MFSTLGNIILKLSKTTTIKFLPSWFNDLHPLFFVAVGFYILNLLTFYKALDTMPVNISYPILASMGFVMLAISSAIFLKEPMSLMQVLGIVTVSIGIFMLSAGFVGEGA